MLGRGQTDKQQAEDGMAHLTDLGGRAGGGDLCEELVGGGDGLGPLFFVEPDVAPIVFDVLDSLVGNDDHFLFDPIRPEENYNYNAGERLTDAIQESTVSPTGTSCAGVSDIQ